jgi:hypothetical protein
MKRRQLMVMATYLFFLAVFMRRVGSQPGAKSDTEAQHDIYHPGEWVKTPVGKEDDGTSHLRAAVENLRSSSSASFAAFAHTVCKQCKHAETACGCELGELNPALSTLRQYTESVLHILETAADIEGTRQEAPAPLLNRVIVQVSGGMGNQIFSTVNALVLAVYTSRALVIVKSGRQMYAWDPVLEVSAILAPRKCRTFTTLSLTDRLGYELIMHEDWSRADLEEVECIHVEEMMEDSYVWYGNARVASFLAENFHGLHFFFLSHFMWMGLSALDEQVQLQSLPRPEAWDGAQTLRDALSALRASGHPIIGVHMRVAVPGPLFLHHVFPSWLHHSSKVLGVVQDSKGGGTLQGQARYLEVEEGYAADCCAAYGEVLHGHLACVSAQVLN